MNRQTGIAAVLILVLVVALWWFWPRAEPEVGPEPAAPAISEPARSATTPADPEADPLPPLEASDPLAIEALRAAGAADGPLAAVLDQETLVRVFVAAVARVAQGASPLPQIGFLAPDGPFRALESDGRLVVDPRSFSRYDALAAAIGRVDGTELVTRYRRLEPLFQEAYADLGVPGDFRVVLLQALDHLLAAPVPRTPIEVEDRVESYAYADPALEDLSAAQKHLLRLGPDNQRIVAAKLRALREGVAGLN